MQVRFGIKHVERSKVSVVIYINFPTHSQPLPVALFKLPQPAPPRRTRMLLILHSISEPDGCRVSSRQPPYAPAALASPCHRHKNESESARKSPTWFCVLSLLDPLQTSCTPKIVQHSVGPCGWYSASAAPAPTAPARIKRAQPPHQLPSGGGVSSNGPHAPVSPTALQSSVPHNNVMPSSARAPAPAGPAPAMHTSQTASGMLTSIALHPTPFRVAKGPSDLLVSSACANPPPAANRLVNMTQFPDTHSRIVQQRAMTSDISQCFNKPHKVFLFTPPVDNDLLEWHHGAISRERAEALLSSSPDGVFLVRESTNFPGDHTLCVRFRGRVEHYREIKLAIWEPINNKKRIPELVNLYGYIHPKTTATLDDSQTEALRRLHAQAVKWATAPDSQTQRLTIDDEEFFDTMNDLIKHYLQDADGLCTKLVRYLPKAAPNGANNNGALQPPYPPHPQQPPPYPPTPHVPPLAHAAFQPTYSQQLPPTTAAATDQVDATNFLEARWVINERDLEIRENIGKGEFGDVMLGILNGNLKVAVKILKDREAASKFRAEATVMASLKHENLVRLLGLVFSASGTCLVTEHCAQGSLLDYLRSRGRHYVTQLNQINFAYDACCGMEYMERSRVVHRDLAARNVLISAEGTAKVADFGLARAELAPDDPADALRVQAKLPIKWTAPEALKYNKFSNKSDMWSFGILLWEIYSFGRVPYPRIPLAEVVRHVERGYRMEAPEGCPAGPYDVMRAAWHADPAQRPAFQHTRRTLAAIRDQAHAQPQPQPAPPHP
ncbi:hypothetical protein MSG28_012293 [Choristoneura fumiferana]|uniref:Uncharacterized protein n=1 Tax=Choristoneura fumiferana TaxID=7141 RepID=A0ACC0KDK9_CHOFU|nr:hypothetical protein MSG28_012293 [Choristoneura fumiferana]